MVQSWLNTCCLTRNDLHDNRDSAMMQFVVDAPCSSQSFRRMENSLLMFVMLSEMK